MSTLNVIQIIGIVGLLVATFFTVKNHMLVSKQRRKVILQEIHADRLRMAALTSLARSKRIQDDMMSVASMTSMDVTRKLREEKENDPERYYKGMGIPDPEGTLMDSFVSGSYDYGVLIGALWMARLVQNGVSGVRCPKKRVYINGVEVGDVLYDGTEKTGKK